jgi:hypothetical protein
MFHRYDFLLRLSVALLGGALIGRRIHHQPVDEDTEVETPITSTRPHATGTAALLSRAVKRDRRESRGRHGQLARTAWTLAPRRLCDPAGGLWAITRPCRACRARLRVTRPRRQRAVVRLARAA